MIQVAREHLLDRNLTHISNYDAEIAQITVFPVNSYVLVAYPLSSQSRPPNKLMCHFKGPYQVVHNIGSAYTILNLVKMSQEVVHISRLRPFHFDDSRVDPRDVAYAEACSYDIRVIHAHRFHGTKRVTNLELQIEWLGFPESHHWTWQLWSRDLASNHKVHEYLTTHRLARFIPAGFRA